MTTNPSHILIARNSRGPHTPSASLSSPTETHAAASGIFRSSGSPSWHTDDIEVETILSTTTDEPIEEIDLHETFTRRARFPGTVKIVVESTTFWAHRDVLVFASPFFEAALSGHWAETSKKGRPQSMSSVITISQLPSIPGQKPDDHPTEMSFAPIDPDSSADEISADDLEEELQDLELNERQGNSQKDVNEKRSKNYTHDPKIIEQERQSSLAKLQKGNLEKGKLAAPSLPTRKRKSTGPPEAVIVLKEEKAHIFHDFLKFVYPHLECNITWNNVEGLMNISHKLCVPSLQNQCMTFLVTHAAGRPIKAMRIAELFEDEDLYRESSRFVLDNPSGWTDDEMGTLSQTTLLKLEKRRTWFLERVLKLGLVNIAKEYPCCATCPDVSNCARLFDEKWRQAFHACFRFGPCQPSMVYRYLRSLEGISPPLALTQTSCQNTAKAFAATLFDRMFSLGVRGSGTDTTPIVPRVPGAAPGPRRQFLYCSLKL